MQSEDRADPLATHEEFQSQVVPDHRNLGAKKTKVISNTAKNGISYNFTGCSTNSNMDDLSLFDVRYVITNQSRFLHAYLIEPLTMMANKRVCKHSQWRITIAWFGQPLFVVQRSWLPLSNVYLCSGCLHSSQLISVLGRYYPSPPDQARTNNLNRHKISFC